MQFSVVTGGRCLWALEVAKGVIAGKRCNDLIIRQITAQQLPRPYDVPATVFSIPYSTIPLMGCVVENAKNCIVKFAISILE